MFALQSVWADSATTSVAAFHLNGKQREPGSHQYHCAASSSQSSHWTLLHRRGPCCCEWLTHTHTRPRHWLTWAVAPCRHLFSDISSLFFASVLTALCTLWVIRTFYLFPFSHLSNYQSATRKIHRLKALLSFSSSMLVFEWRWESIFFTQRTCWALRAGQSRPCHLPGLVPWFPFCLTHFQWWSKGRQPF